MYRFLKRTAVFLLGSYTVVAQVTILREFLVVFLGNELCLGIIFSSWFLGVSLGAAAGARPARRTDEGERTFLLAASVMLLLAPFVLLLVRSLRGILSVPPGQYIPFMTLLLSTWCLVIPFSFFIGFVFPFACLLALEATGRGIRNVGHVYVIEALGSIAGGLLFSFALVGRFAALDILLGWAGVILAVLFFLSLEPGASRAGRLVTGLACAGCALIPLSGAGRLLDGWSIRLRWETLNPGIPLVASVDSRYENIALGERSGQYDVFGSGQYYFSFPDPYAYAAATHMIMSEHPDPKRVLLIGGGVGGMLGELLRYRLPDLKYVELDPALIRLTEQYLGPEGKRALMDPAVRLYYGDGRRFVKETDERFDMIIVNVPDPSTAMLNRFYTREFYEEAGKALAPGGVLSTRLSAPADYYGEEVGSYAASVYITLRSVFPHVIVAPGEENYFFASPDAGVITSDMAILQRRWEARGIETEYFSPYHFTTWWLPERVEFTRRALETQKGVSLNTDFRPVTYYLNLMLWARFSGSRIIGLLRRIEQIGVGWYIAVVICLLIARLLYLALSGESGEGRRAFHALCAVAAMGFTAMALEIILIFAFQNVYGYVYGMVGAIVALFMAGLAGGGFASNALLGKENLRWDAWLAGIALALAGFAWLVPAVIRRVSESAAHPELAFMGLVMFAGFICGLEFPIASRIYMMHAASVGRAAARVNACDHIGACVGSLVTGVVFVPLLGLKAACLFLAVANGACGLLLLTGVRRPA